MFSDGIPIALSPPSVSMLKTSVAEYLSGSRVLIDGPLLSELALKLLLLIAEFALLLAFAFAFAFEFVFRAGWHANTKIAPRIAIAAIVPTSDTRLNSIFRITHLFEAFAVDAMIGLTEGERFKNNTRTILFEECDLTRV